jgi:GNAT superfamily N-acetyltransferase
MRTPSRTIALRVYRDDDEQAVLRLLDASLGGGPAGRRPPAFFHWKHLANPFGRSFMLVADDDGRIVGLRAFMRWRFHAGDGEVRAVRAVDTATHPDYQGQGIFSRLTLAALDELAGDADLVFNTPNERSLPGYMKMGWRPVGDVPIRVRMRHPLRVARRRRSLRSTRSGARPPPPVEAPSAAEALRDAEGLSLLLRETETNGGQIATPRTLEYLRWRYADAPLLDYRAAQIDGSGGTDGLAIFRVRRRGALWETTIPEVLVPSGDSRTARRLLRAIARAADVDHMTCSFPSGTAAARAARFTTVAAPRGMTLVVRPLRENLLPDPGLLDSWALSLGDLEVF